MGTTIPSVELHTSSGEVYHLRGRVARIALWLARNGSQLSQPKGQVTFDWAGHNALSVEVKSREQVES